MFEVDPSQIEALDSKQLVLLLRRLLHSEALGAGLSLRGISVPLQITVADGGEDGRIAWQGGNAKTDYIPSRITFFQSKASSIRAAGWKKECWTKKSQRGTQTRVLSDALKELSSVGGAYIGFTTEALIGAKRAAYVTAIKDGITQAGGNPASFAAIDVYGANEISAWADRHPAVALWIAETVQGRDLGGFQTIGEWGNKSDFGDTAYVIDVRPRFAVGMAPTLAGRGKRDTNKLTAPQARERIVDHVAEPGKAVRVIGPSGLGKSRFVYELMRDVSTARAGVLSLSAVFCDFRSVASSLPAVLTTIANSGRPALFVVDECPREAAEALGEIVSGTASQLRLLTMDIDDRTIPGDAWLNLSISPGDDELVTGIIRQHLPKATEGEVAFVRDLCGGFPRIAVLAARRATDRQSVLVSIEDVVERVLRGSSISERDEVRALETLALFGSVGVDEEYAPQLDAVATWLARQTGDEMYEHLAKAAQHDLVGRRGQQMSAQPLPIAMYLATRRLRLLRVQTVEAFIGSVDQALVLSMLGQWRNLDTAQTVRRVAAKLLASGAAVGTRAALMTDFGARCLDALVHVLPDMAMSVLSRELDGLTHEELLAWADGRRHIVEALAKLVFRRQTFGPAASLLLRLAAAENEQWSNNASGLFKQLFQVELSGTEAGPAERFTVLDEGLSSDNAAVASVCVEALSSSFDIQVSRMGDAGQIGTRPPLSDWRPEYWSEVYDFYRQALARLHNTGMQRPALMERCEQIIVHAVRTLLSTPVYKDVGKLLVEIASEKGVWYEAVEAVGDWLYFDRKDAPEEVAAHIRKLYDDLMPQDVVGKAILFTKFWSGDIRDPDVQYSDNDSDFTYSERSARALAAEIATDRELTRKAIQIMIVEELKGSFAFGEELAAHYDQPAELGRVTLDLVDEAVGATGVGLLRGILAGVDRRDAGEANHLLGEALSRPSLKGRAVEMYTAVSLDADRLQQVVDLLGSGALQASDCAFLSYGRGLDNIEPTAIRPLLRELATHGADGLWTALEIANMYRYGSGQLSSEIASELETILVDPRLLEDVRNGGRDGHFLERTIERIQKAFGLTPDFAGGLSEQVTRLCKVDDHGTFLALDGPVRHIVGLIVHDHPDIIWREVARLFEVATPIERYRLSDVIGPDRHKFDGRSHTAAGPMFGIPDAIMFNWVDQDVPGRVGLLVEFYPMLSFDREVVAWHPAMEQLATKYGEVENFRQALSRRISPRSWSGSRVPSLELFVEPLRAWSSHDVRPLAAWAREQLIWLEGLIAEEQEAEGDERY